MDHLLPADHCPDQRYGIFFPIRGFTAALGTGIVSLVLLALALYGLYSKHLSGAWRWIYVTTAVASLYLNVLVLIVKSFQKISVLKHLASTQSDPPFLVAQAIALFTFVVLGTLAATRFHPPRLPPVNRNPARSK